jgi:hypothetical protein
MVRKSDQRVARFGSVGLASCHHLRQLRQLPVTDTFGDVALRSVKCVINSWVVETILRRNGAQRVWVSGSLGRKSRNRLLTLNTQPHIVPPMCCFVDQVSHPWSSEVVAPDPTCTDSHCEVLTEHMSLSSWASCAHVLTQSFGNLDGKTLRFLRTLPQSAIVLVCTDDSDMRTVSRTVSALVSRSLAVPSVLAALFLLVLALHLQHLWVHKRQKQLIGSPLVHLYAAAVLGGQQLSCVLPLTNTSRQPNLPVCSSLLLQLCFKPQRQVPSMFCSLRACLTPAIRSPLVSAKKGTVTTTLII